MVHFGQSLFMYSCPVNKQLRAYLELVGYCVLGTVLGGVFGSFFGWIVIGLSPNGSPPWPLPMIAGMVIGTILSGVWALKNSKV